MQATLNEQMTQILTLSGATSVRAPSFSPPVPTATTMAGMHGFRLARRWVGHIVWRVPTRLRSVVPLASQY